MRSLYFFSAGKYTEDGLPIYTEEELGIREDGGGS
jgi:hypothetical protein